MGRPPHQLYRKLRPWAPYNQRAPDIQNNGSHNDRDRGGLVFRGTLALIVGKALAVRYAVTVRRALTVRAASGCQRAPDSQRLSGEPFIVRRAHHSQRGPDGQTGPDIHKKETPVSRKDPGCKMVRGALIVERCFSGRLQRTFWDFCKEFPLLNRQDILPSRAPSTRGALFSSGGPETPREGCAPCSPPG